MSERSSDDPVGYGKPPQHSRFRKGQSGNPKGRPRTIPSLAQLANQVFNEKVAIKENGERRVITKLQAALKQLANKAASGDHRAIREMIRIHTAIGTVSRDEPQQHGKKETGGYLTPEQRQKAALAIPNQVYEATSPGGSRPTVSAEPLSDEEWERQYGTR